MNLPNKLTTMRVILIPFFVFFMLAPYFEGYGKLYRSCHLYRGKSYRYVRWKDRKKI